MKKIFITGARGFIGKNINERLKDRYQLLTPSRKELDLLNEKQVDNYFKKNKIDIVLHCAIVGGSIKEQEVPSALSDNLKILFNILRNKDKFRKMIQLGSGSEYGRNRSLIKVKETDFGKSIPNDDYSFFKFTASKIIESLENIVCLRIFGLFGKYDDYHLRFISNSIYRNLQGLPMTINQNRFFDYLYIDDFVKIIDHFICHQSRHKFYNIGTGKKIDLVAILKIINEVGNKKSKIIVENPGLGYEYTCDNARLMKELRNFNFTDLKEAISKLYYWYKENLTRL